MKGEVTDIGSYGRLSDMKKYFYILSTIFIFYIFTGCGSVNDTCVDMPVESEIKWAMCPAVMVDGTLYFTTGYSSDALGDAACDGMIESQVDGSELPAEDNQSNFGTGFPYRYGNIEGTIEVFSEGCWWIYATEYVKDNNLYLENDPPRVTGLDLNGYTGYMDEFYTYTNEFTECDYDGDGKADRLYRVDDVSYYMSEYRIDFGNGDKLYTENVSETAYPHVYPVDLDKDGDEDIVLTYTVEPADREPFTWCDIFCYDSSHRIYMKEESVLHSSGGISHLPIKLQRISSYEAAFTVVNTDFTGFIGLDRYYQKYDDVMLDQFWENVESNDNIIEAMIVYAEVEYGDDPCIHCYTDTVSGGWYYIEFDIVFEEGEYQITNLNKVFDPFSAEFSDSFASGIIPSYVPSDVILEEVKISSDDPYEGMITSIGDFNKDGLTEKIVVDYRDILAEGIAVPGWIAVYDADGNILWNDTFSLAYAGWCRFYIAEIDNIPCLIRYFPPTARQGSWECYLQVYTLNSDNEFTASEQIFCDGTQESAEECKTIAEQYLEHAIMLVSTMDSELKVYK